MCERDLRQFSGIGRAICAFANAEGGLIILRVDDLGTIVGVREDPRCGAGKADEFSAFGM